MTRINIPSQVFTGFKLLSELSESQMESLTTFISKLPIDIEYVEVASKFDELLEITIGRELLQTLLSFNKVLKETESNNEKLAKSLTDSFIHLSKEALSDDLVKRLEANLQIVLNNYNCISTIIDTRKMLRSSGNSISEFNIHSDIRLLFTQNKKNDKRSAIISHKMQFEYTGGESPKEISFTVDIDDLKKIKIEIEKAIENDQLIRDDYKDVLQLIF